jgi:hypothetical protein
MISADDLAALLRTWREGHREVEVALLGPGLSVKVSGMVDEIRNKELVVLSNQSFIRVGFGTEANAFCTRYEQAEGAARIEMERNNLEAVLELRPSDEISCSISVKAPILHLPQPTSLN